VAVPAAGRKKGAASATSVLDSDLTGAYFRSGKRVVPSTLAQDDDAAARLWKIAASSAA